MSLSLSQLGRHLLGAAEVLRGPPSPHQYQDQLLPIVFLKHASDVPRPHALIVQKGGTATSATFPEPLRPTGLDARLDHVAAAGTAEG
ncbi:type I restriction-modification system subunit M N-terminal domain-containing protein [Streptomyces griseoviridis]|uniref:type I restriction-modification system subunit M N-terminal domain-containing protein n=1 Tax=Streptomyces griseoviridis TaxID=45398 RepID=UPI0033E03ABD